MNSPWIRAKDLSEYYSFGRSHAYNLIREFKATADEEDWLPDGKITLIRKTSFEEFLRNRGRRK